MCVHFISLSPFHSLSLPLSHRHNPLASTVEHRKFFGEHCKITFCGAVYVHVFECGKYQKPINLSHTHTETFWQFKWIKMCTTHTTNVKYNRLDLLHKDLLTPTTFSMPQCSQWFPVCILHTSVFNPFIHSFRWNFPTMKWVVFWFYPSGQVENNNENEKREEKKLERKWATTNLISRKCNNNLCDNNIQH